MKLEPSEPYIIAEIGSNCFKFPSQEENFQLAREQIAVARACGAHAVKFQLFTYEELYGIPAPEKYKRTYEMPREWVPRLKELCDNYKIDFMCSAFSHEGFKFVDKFVSTHKIASPEAPDKDLVDTVQSLSGDIVISNGCLTYDEQYRLVGSDTWDDNDVLLECVSNYPANISEYNFTGISDIAQTFKINWGLSDHTRGSTLSVIARQCGAVVFEKHVDLAAIAASVTPDTCVSMGRTEFEGYCRTLRLLKPTRQSYDTLKKKSASLYGRQASGYRPLLS